MIFYRLAVAAILMMSAVLIPTLADPHSSLASVLRTSSSFSPNGSALTISSFTLTLKPSMVSSVLSARPETAQKALSVSARTTATTSAPASPLISDGVVRTTTSLPKRTVIDSKRRKWSSLGPNNVKAGVAGGDPLRWLTPYLGWYYDWSPTPNNSHAGGIQRMPMLWGLGKTSDPLDEPRFQEFQKLPKPAARYVAGFNEPDFQGQGSSGYIDPQTAAQAWDQYIAPHGRAGAKLISPSCAKQADETWMQPFLSHVQYQPDIIAVHVFANNTDRIQLDLNHYAKYGKPLMVTEFACIDYQDHPTRYCDQNLTNSLIARAVQIFESDDRVIGYALSDAYNGPASYLTNAYTGTPNPTLTTTGHAYLEEISK